MSVDDANFRLFQILDRFHRLQEASARPDLSRKEFFTMQLLRRMSANGPVRMGDLARRMDMSLSALSKTMQSLEDRNYVRREIDPTDRRYTLASLTEKGYALEEELRSNADSRIRAVFDRFGQENTDRFFLLADQLLATAEQDLSEQNSH
ncbi:MAG: MarR family transcriptional regulator [Oscillospiraceae bacterium]|nr:MarR family transcriptional regulator [Oscillospiraceae bacterium]